MGGISLLLAVATIGVTYGWQPDGKGGVEYIVQVQPEQLNQLRHSGEISSSIDPSVQGHVSRVIIRVGKDTVPRNSDGLVALADRTLIAQPRIAQPRIDGDSQAVMKPDANNGFSLPNSVAGSAAQARERIASAAGNFANSAADRLARDAQRAKAAGQVPNFTGDQANPDARLTQNQANQARDAQWLKMSTAAQRDVANSAINPNRPQPEQMGPPDPRTDPRFRNTRFQTPGNQTFNTQAQDPRFRSGQQDPSAVTNARLAAAREQESNRKAGLGSTPNFGNPPAGISIPRTGATQSTFEQLQARSRQSDWPANDRPSTTGIVNNAQATGTSAKGNMDSYLRNNQAKRDPFATGTPASTPTDPRSLMNLAQQRLRSGEVDPRLTVAQVETLPPNAWTVDVYGRPINQHNQLLDKYGRVITNAPANMNQNSRPSTVTTGSTGQLAGSPQYQIPVGREQAIGNNDPYYRTANVYPAPSTQNYQPRIVQTGPRIAPNPQVQNPQVQNPQVQNPQAQSHNVSNPNARRTVPATNVTSASETSFHSQEQAKRSIASQPFFKVFLLVSLIGNVFLMGIMNTLWTRHRDLIASKRNASTPMDLAREQNQFA